MSARKIHFINGNRELSCNFHFSVRCKSPSEVKVSMEIERIKKKKKKKPSANFIGNTIKLRKFKNGRLIDKLVHSFAVLYSDNILYWQLTEYDRVLKKKDSCWGRRVINDWLWKHTQGKLKTVGQTWNTA